MQIKIKQTMEEQVIELLKRGWFSNFGMQQILKSSSADRAMRSAKEKGIDGWKFISRVKKNAPVRCFEYRLIKKDDGLKDRV